MEEKDLQRVVNSDTWIYQDARFIEWLGGTKRYGYGRKCKKDMIDFLEWCKKKGIIKTVSATELLAKHKELIKNEETEHFIADSLPKFAKDYFEQHKEEMTYSSAVGKTKAIRGFFRFYRKPLLIRKGALDVEEEATQDFTFTREILARMVQVSDIEGKAKIMTGKDLGLRVGDFRRLKRKKIVEQIQLADQKVTDYPLEFEVKTRKEGIVAVGHLMHETVEVLRAYWEIAPESEFAFPNSDPAQPCSEFHLNNLLKNAFANAFPNITEHSQIRWHCLRDFKTSALGTARVPKPAIDIMTGHKIDPQTKSYWHPQLKKLFKDAESQLTLTGLTNSNHSKIGHLEEENKKLKDALALIYKVAKDRGLTKTLPKTDIQKLEAFLVPKPKKEEAEES